MSEWISVKERLPDESEVVLVYGENACDWVHEVALLEGELWVDRGEGLDGVSHWMPLPEPPATDLTIEEALKLAVMDLSLFANYFCGGTRATHEVISAACGRVVSYREVLERAGKW